MKLVKDNDIEPEIANKRNRRVNFRFDKTVYNGNLFGKVKENRD